MSHPLSLAHKFEQMDALGREAQYLQADGRKCSCGYPHGPCLRSQTDCVAITPRQEPNSGGTLGGRADG